MARNGENFFLVVIISFHAFFQITEVCRDHRFVVHFFGTGDTATVTIEALKDYNDRNRSRFNNRKLLRLRSYKEAVELAEINFHENALEMQTRLIDNCLIIENNQKQLKKIVQDSLAPLREINLEVMPNINQFMLLKHPGIVHLMLSLKFMEKSKKISQLASEICDQIQVF